MRIESPYLGTVAYEDEQVIDFPDGILGYPHLRRFVLLAPEEEEPLEFLIPLASPELVFPAIAPELVEPGYGLSLGSEDRRALRLAAGEEPRILCIATVAPVVEQTTINLAAPIVICPSSRRGRQILCEDSGYSLAEPLFAATAP